jgi:hypothetical protein
VKLSLEFPEDDVERLAVECFELQRLIICHSKVHCALLRATRDLFPVSTSVSVNWTDAVIADCLSQGFFRACQRGVISPSDLRALLADPNLIERIADRALAMSNCNNLLYPYVIGTSATEIRRLVYEAMKDAARPDVISLTSDTCGPLTPVWERYYDDTERWAFRVFVKGNEDTLTLRCKKDVIGKVRLARRSSQPLFDIVAVSGLFLLSQHPPVLAGEHLSICLIWSSSAGPVTFIGKAPASSSSTEPAGPAPTDTTSHSRAN